MPEFLLPDADGALVHSAELLAQGPLVVTFIRGDWCPYCSATLDALQAALPHCGGRRRVRPRQESTAPVHS